MSGETNLSKLIQTMKPTLNQGEYVFVTVKQLHTIRREDTIGEFREDEGTTVIIEKNKAEMLNLTYDYIASWITLTVHSSLEAVGLTAVVSSALAKKDISCNVVAGYYHDHIFVDSRDKEKAMETLVSLTQSYE